ncbi:MAG: 4Fe-4S dicluster domain-containing protein, partial [Bacteroides sp.]|nr:4Fe-4S dicluster domain-containing protein [Bacteroides sp.]
FINEVVRPINAQNGDLLPVSAFKGYEDGTWPQGTAAYEKRGVGAFVPTWTAENCIQCNKCAYVCPHACIRPFVLDEAEAAGLNAPMIDMKAPAAMKGMKFRMQVGVMDCLSCGNCVDVCPDNPKAGGPALKMVPLEGQLCEAANWEYCVKNVKTKQALVDIKQSPKNSQFATPLFEFSGACSGCGETPYVKLISQLFGDRQMVANATGCSSIYSGSIPSTPYTTNEKGQDPAWANSLFEDFCEFGLGMIATTYGYVYVAQIAMGADQSQCLKAIREAEAYPGPSIVIAYAPCINHGLKKGIGKAQAEEAAAVECGYWHLWRYNPALEEEGKNPFTLDSKEPKWEGFQDFLKGEVRFASVMKQFPTEAAGLFQACEDMAKKRYQSYIRMTKMDWSNE